MPSMPSITTAAHPSIRLAIVSSAAANSIVLLRRADCGLRILESRDSAIRNPQSAILLLAAFGAAHDRSCSSRGLGGVDFRFVSALLNARVRHALDRTALRKARTHRSIVSDDTRRDEEQALIGIATRASVFEKLTEQRYARDARRPIDRMTFGVDVDSAHHGGSSVCYKHGGFG